MKKRVRPTTKRIVAELMSLCEPVSLERQAATYATGTSVDYSDPHILAAQLVNRFYARKSVSALRFYRAEWYHHDGRGYLHMVDRELRANVNRQLRTLLDEVDPATKVTQSFVQNVLQALEGMCLVPSQINTPAWLGDGPPLGSGDLLSVANGILDVGAAVANKRARLYRSTPKWFSLVQLGYRYRPLAHCGQWDKFLEQVLPDAVDRRLLQEFIGLCLVYDTTFQRFLIMVGEGANGKSVITSVITKLLGPGNVSHVGLERFGDKFGLAETVGKLANIVSEIGPTTTVAEDKLKEISAGDEMTIEAKYQQGRSVIPTVRLIFATNEVPKFVDRTSGMWRRLLLLPFNVTIPEDRQNPNLVTELCRDELPGILNWAIRGLRRLRKRGKFAPSKTVKEAVSDHKLESNPTRVFLEEKYVAKQGERVSCQTMHSEYTFWCNSQNVVPLTEHQFGREVRRAFTDVQRKQVRTKGTRRYFYCGLVRRR